MSNKDGRFDYKIGKNRTRAGIIKSSSGGTVSYRSRIDGKIRIFKIPKFKNISDEGSVTSITGRGVAKGTSTTGSGTSMTPGQVVSKNPDGTYVVDLYAVDLLSVTSTVNVTQLQIDVDEIIPVGTWVVVAQHPSGFIMQVPVWLEEAEE